MTSTTPRIITIALAMLAIAVPAATAMPARHNRGPAARRRRRRCRTCPHPAPAASDRPSRTSETPTTARLASRPPDPRSRVDPGPAAPYSPAQLKPISTPAGPADDGPSPFVYIIPAVVLIAMFAAGSFFDPRRAPPAGGLPDGHRPLASAG